jgi:hypothetical protein
MTIDFPMIFIDVPWFPVIFPWFPHGFPHGSPRQAPRGALDIRGCYARQQRSFDFTVRVPRGGGTQKYFDRENEEPCELGVSLS